MTIDNPTQLDALNDRIDKLLEEMDGTNGDSEEYSKTTVNLVKLVTLKHEALKIENDFETEKEKLSIETEKVANEKDKIYIERDKIHIDQEKLRHDHEKFVHEKEKDRSWKPSPDAVVTAAASIVGILFVLHYEKIGIVTSKALSFVGKMK